MGRLRRHPFVPTTLNGKMCRHGHRPRFAAELQRVCRVIPERQFSSETTERQKDWLANFAGGFGVGGYWLLGDRLSFEYLATQESALREYRQSDPFWAAILAIAVYVAVAGFSLPGAAVLTLACGWYFGFC